MIIMITILLENLVSLYLMWWTRMGPLTRLLDCTGETWNDYLRLKNLCWRIYVCLTCGNKSWNVSGLDQFEARKKLWSELEETGLAVKKESHTLRVPRSQRGGEVRTYYLYMYPSKFQGFKFWWKASSTGNFMSWCLFPCR
jgi:hypothetical protein